MAIQFLPIIGTISNVASAALEVYRKTSDQRKTRDAAAAVNERIARLEDANLEHTHLLSDLAADLEEFAQGVRRELEKSRKRETRLIFVGSSAIAIALASLILSAMLLLR